MNTQSNAAPSTAKPHSNSAENPRNEVVSGTLSGVSAAVRELVSSRWPGQSSRHFIAVGIRTRGGIVIRVFPDHKGRKPNIQQGE